VQEVRRDLQPLREHVREGEAPADSCGEKGTLVSVTHVPPLGVLDVTRDGSHAGSRAVLDFIRRRAPALHVAGHIH